MSYWTIKAFKTDRGENAVKNWVEEQPKKAQAAIKVRLRYLATQQIWDRPHVKKLKGSKHIFEIRVTSIKVQYRPLGFYGPNQKEFTLLIGAIEKDSEFKPKTAIKTAESRRELILKDDSYAIKYFNDI